MKILHRTLHRDYSGEYGGDLISHKILKLKLRFTQ